MQPAEPTVQVKDGDADLTQMTRDEFQSRINSDRGFRDRYLQDPEKYEKLIVEEKPEETPQGASPQGTPGEKPQEPTPQGSAPAADEKLTLALPKSVLDLLGTYGVNRSTEEAILEALKGNREKDNLITFLRKKDQDAGEERVSLKKQLELFRQQQKPAAGTPDPTPKPANDKPGALPDLGINLDDLPEGEGLFEVENQAKLVKALKGLASQNKALLAQVEKTQGELSQVKSEAEQESVDDLDKEARETDLARELREIEELQVSNPALKTSKQFRDLDQEVARWIVDVGYIAGVGREYNDAAIAAAERLFTDKTPAGDELREKCRQAGITPPEDLDKHREIMTVRRERNKYRDQLRQNMAARLGRDVRDHELPDMPFTYLDFYGKLRPRDLAGELMKARVEGAKDVMKAASASANVAKEVPPTAGAPTLELQGVSPEQMSKLLSRPSSSYTPQEAKVVLEWYTQNQVPPPNEVVRRASQT